MTTPHIKPARIYAPTSPEDVSTFTLLGVCASLKPASGHQGRSATRSILSYALDTVGAVYPNVSLLDLRDHPLPFFDGRMPHECDNPTLEFVLSCVGRAGALLLSVPAYWSGVSGVFKNFVDVLCGPIYDMPEAATTVFENKPVSLVIVGADEESANAGRDQAQHIMSSTGARLVGQPIVVANPRSGGVDAEALGRDLVVLGAELARHAYLARARKTL